MDFGDILNKWEKQRCGNGSAAQNPMETWMQAHEIYNKDAEQGERQVCSIDKRRRLRVKKPDAQLDIHGLDRNEAWVSLETFFADSKNKGLEKILVIHGKGNNSAGEPVLKRTVMNFIERCPYAGESGREKTRAGGEGATWILLKETVKRSS